MYPVHIRELAPVRVVSIRHVGPYEAAGSAFDQLWAWAHARGPIPANLRVFSIYHDDPACVPADRLRCDAAMYVGPDAEGDGVVTVREIPGGRHAVLAVKGPYSLVPQASRWLLETWLPQHGERPARAPFDEYLNNPATVPPEELRTDICLPLAG
ncbi:AraC family transcriptional regulator [Chelatococcus caeni]|nr:GyrI-like domain-containing protein [Chelatococcus caeni]